MNAVPDMTNIPSGLNEASKVELVDTGFTLYEHSWKLWQKIWRKEPIRRRKKKENPNNSL